MNLESRKRFGYEAQERFGWLGLCFLAIVVNSCFSHNQRIVLIHLQSPQ